MMKDAYKAVIRTAGFLLCVIILSLVIVHPYYVCHMQGANRQDAPVRKQLSGTLDFLFVGSSQTRRGFDPAVLDAELGVNSYNLSLSGIALRARQYMLKKELERNPVSTVVIEVAFDVLTYDRKTENTERVLGTMGNLDNYRERLQFLLTTVRPDEYGKIYYYALLYGTQCWEKVFQGRGTTYTTAKGFVGEDKAADLRMTQEEFNKSYQNSSYGKYLQSNLKCLGEMISLSQQKGARVVIVVTPVADRGLIRYDNVGSLDDCLGNLASEYQCEYYNFNRIKNKCTLFPEELAFIDVTHLSTAGAETFTSALADVLRSDTPEDYFWDSHEQAQENNEYLRPLLESYVKS